MPLIAHTTSGQMASSRHPGAIQDGGCDGEGGSWSDYFDMDGTDFVPDVLNRGESSTARLPTLFLPPPPPPQPRPSPLPPRVSCKVPGMLSLESVCHTSIHTSNIFCLHSSNRTTGSWFPRSEHHWPTSVFPLPTRCKLPLSDPRRHHLRSVQRSPPSEPLTPSRVLVDN